MSPVCNETARDLYVPSQGSPKTPFNAEIDTEVCIFAELNTTE